MSKCWSAMVGLIVLGVATPTFAQFGPPGGKAVEARVNKIESELRKTQEHIQALIAELKSMRTSNSAEKHAGKGAGGEKFGKGKFEGSKSAEQKKVEEVKKWFAREKWSKEGHKGHAGFAGHWMHAHHGMFAMHHGTHGLHDGMFAMHHGAHHGMHHWTHHGMHGTHEGHDSHALLLMIVHELDAIRKGMKK